MGTPAKQITNDLVLMTYFGPHTEYPEDTNDVQAILSAHKGQAPSAIEAKASAAVVLVPSAS